MACKLMCANGASPFRRGRTSRRTRRCRRTDVASAGEACAEEMAFVEAVASEVSLVYELAASIGTELALFLAAGVVYVLTGDCTSSRECCRIRCRGA